MSESQVRQVDTSRSEVLIAYPTADRFLHEYTRSLQRGWLAIEGSHELCPGMQVKVRLRVPGFSSFEFQAQVVECVAATDHSARARLVYCGPVEVLRNALFERVELVRRRLQSAILVDDEPLRVWLETLGYRVHPLPPPEQLVAVIAHSEAPVAAVLVPPDQAVGYTKAATPAGAAQLVHVIDNTTEPGALLAAVEEE